MQKKTPLNNIKYNKNNRLTIGQFSKVLLVIHNAHTVQQRALAVVS